MKIDAEKLLRLIEEELAITHGPCIETRFCIGRKGKNQIQIVVTNDKDSFCSELKELRCIS